MTTSPRYLLAGEPLNTYIPGLDTGVNLAQEILRRQIPLDYCDLSKMDYQLPPEKYLTQLRVAQIKRSSHEGVPAFDLGPWRTAAVEEYDVILQRKDPPVDEHYIGHAKQFMNAPPRIVQMNHPSLTWKLSEHLLPQSYPEFSVPTHLVKSFEALEATVRQMKGDTVAKPMSLFSGKGIEFFSPATPAETLRAYWTRWQPEIILQPFLKEIETVGDLRVLVMNEKIVGSVLRKPSPGSRLANLHQGGSAHFFKITAAQIAASEAIGRDLCPKGLYLLGIDFIGDYVTEINITCPSAVPQINAVMKIRAEEAIIGELEALRLSR